MTLMNRPARLQRKAVAAIANTPKTAERRFMALTADIIRGAPGKSNFRAGRGAKGPADSAVQRRHRTDGPWAMKILPSRTIGPPFVPPESLIQRGDPLFGSIAKSCPLSVPA